MKLPLAKIVIDKDLRPRELNWLTVYQYKEAMRTGADFPPVTVGKDGDLYVLLDGAHRLEAWRQLKTATVDVRVSPAKKDAFFEEAVRLNVTNGRQLSVQERIMATAKLREKGYSWERVSKIVFMPVNDLRRLVAERVVRDDGFNYVVKAPLVRVKDKMSSERVQDHIAADSQVHMLGDLLMIVKEGLLDLENPVVRQIAGELLTALTLVLQQQETA